MYGLPIEYINSEGTTFCNIVSPVVNPLSLFSVGIDAQAFTVVVLYAVFAIVSISVMSKRKVAIEFAVGVTVNGVSTVAILVVPLYDIIRLTSPAEGPASIETVTP